MSLEIYTIEIHRPAGVSAKELIAYMQEAIEDWGGQRMPPGVDPEYPDGDPLFYPWKMKGLSADKQKHRLPRILIKRRYP